MSTIFDFFSRGINSCHFVPCQARSVRLCGTVVGTCQWYRGMHTCVCDTVEGTCHWYRGRGMPVPSWTWAVRSARRSPISSSLICTSSLMQKHTCFNCFNHQTFLFSVKTGQLSNMQTLQTLPGSPRPRSSTNLSPTNQPTNPVQTLIAQTQWSCHPCRYFGHKREETNTCG